MLGLVSSAIALAVFAYVALYGAFPIQFRPFGWLAVNAVVVLVVIVAWYSYYLNGVKGIAKEYALESLQGTLRENIRTNVLPREVRFATIHRVFSKVWRKMSTILRKLSGRLKEGRPRD